MKCYIGPRGTKAFAEFIDLFFNITNFAELHVVISSLFKNFMMSIDFMRSCSWCVGMECTMPFMSCGDLMVAVLHLLKGIA